MKTIHHATVKKAEKLGFTFDAVSNIATEYTIRWPNGGVVLSGLDAPQLVVDLLDIKIARENGDDEPEAESEADEPEAEDADDNGRSVVKKSYKRKYRPHKNKNGDEIGRLVSAHVVSDETGDDGRPRIDQVKLAEFAKANGCWVDGYAYLNAGMQRMNICNRLRALVKNGHDVIWA